MRAIRQIAFCLGFCLLTQVAMGEEFPYRAEIQTDDAFAMSGPGDNFYPTARLRRGEAVEVHRQDAGGWCAIRPPQGSFSYVNALNVTSTGSKVASVTADRVPSRVGSSLADRRDAIHVYLNQGEVVSLLDTIRDASSGETWCKISPPAGEFRWVHSKCFVRQAVDVAETPSRYPVAAIADRSESTVRKETVGRPDVTPIVLTGGTSEGWVAVDGGNRVPVPAYSSPDSPSGRGGDSNGPENREPISVAMQYDLDQIDIGISRVVAQDPARWDLTRLRKQADSLFDRQTNATERAAIRALLNKVDRYEDLHKRSIQFAQARDTGGARLNPAAVGGSTVGGSTVGGSTAAGVAGPSFPSGYGPGTGGGAAGQPAYIGGVPIYPGSAVGTVGGTPGGYDSVGRLTPVVSRRQGAPSFALINPKGEVVAFVTPSPGVDLQTLVGREVGVNGARGFIPEFNKPHLTAMRATVIR